MTTALIVQARMGSTRLPGKVLADVGGQPMLMWQMQRLREARGIDRFVIATTTETIDDQVARVGLALGWNVYRGATHDVLGRFLGAAKQARADQIIRSTADCPLIDPLWVEAVSQRFQMGDVDHVEVWGLPDGMGVETFSANLLEFIDSETDDPQDREHVSLFIRRHPERFALAHVDSGYGLDRERWTVDTEDDLAFIRAVLGNWPCPRTVPEIAALIREHPEWRALNAAVPMGPIDQQLFDARSTRRDFDPARGDL